MCETKVNGVQCRRAARFWVMTDADEVDFDAVSGDSLLQVMVLGEIVFG